MKRIIISGCFAILFLIIFCFSVSAVTDETKEIYDSQLKVSGADKLYSSLPEQTRKMLGDIGMGQLDYESVGSFDSSVIFQKALELTAQNGKTPMSAIALSMGIMMICALFEGMDISPGNKALGGIISSVGALCVCTTVLIPLSSLISRSAGIINGAAGFTLIYVPIMTGLLISSGQPAAASSYYTMLMGASQLITQVCSRLIIPFLNVFLALSVTSSLPSGVKISSLCDSIFKSIKWVLTFITGIFTAVLSAQTLVAASIGNVRTRALKITVSSFVPLVGGALSDALGTFTGCLELLKSGVGVFIIIACVITFLPVLIECILWRITLSVLSAVSEILGTERIKPVFDTASSAIAVLNAVLLCVSGVFVISTVIILLLAK